MSKINSNLIQEDLNNLHNIITDEIDLKIEDVYSTSEIKTNKIASNGKPVYRREINNITMSSGVAKQVPTGITNLDTIEDVRTIIKAGSQVFVGNQYYNSSIFFSANFDLANNNNYVLYDVNGSALVGKLRIIIEYTKTTD